MSYNSVQKRSMVPQHYEVPVRVRGGSAAVTKVFGTGVSVAYVSTGTITVTFIDPPGTFLGMAASFDAATPSGVAGYTAVATTPTFSSSLVVTVSIFNNSNTLADLTSTQDVLLMFELSEVKVPIP